MNTAKQLAASEPHITQLVETKISSKIVNTGLCQVTKNIALFYVNFVFTAQKIINYYSI